MEDYIELLKKYRILIVVYILIFVVVLYFIWRPQKEETSLFSISEVDETSVYDKYYNYYKGELDKIFLEANYEKIYNEYLLEDYKTQNYISLENVEELIKYKCESFYSAKTTKYTASKSGNYVIYHVLYTYNDSENSLDIYEFSPYNFKISFGKKVYDSSSQSSSDETNYTKKDNESGLEFEITKDKQFDDFVQYSVKITNTSSEEISVNLIQNNNLVLVDSDNKYHIGSISKNDLITLEKDNYTTFTVGFKINLQTQLNVKSLKFLKIEKDNDIEEIEISI